MHALRRDPLPRCLRHTALQELVAPWHRSDGGGLLDVRQEHPPFEQAARHSGIRSLQELQKEIGLGVFLYLHPEIQKGCLEVRRLPEARLQDVWQETGPGFEARRRPQRLHVPKLPLPTLRVRPRTTEETRGPDGVQHSQLRTVALPNMREKIALAALVAHCDMRHDSCTTTAQL